MGFVAEAGAGVRVSATRLPDRIEEIRAKVVASEHALDRYAFMGMLRDLLAEADRLITRAVKAEQRVRELEEVIAWERLHGATRDRLPFHGPAKSDLW